MNQLRYFLATPLAFLVAAAALGCVAAPVEEDAVGVSQQALTGGVNVYWEDNADGNDLWGIPLKPPGSTNIPTCFLSGVVGRLNVGHSWHNYPHLNFTGPAVVEVSHGDNPTLTARAGFYLDYSTPDVTADFVGKVGGQATCVYHPWVAGVDMEVTSGAYTDELLTVASSRRQCFLTGLRGGEGTWNSSSSYARVVQRKGASFPYLSYWWLEASIPSTIGNNWPSVRADCVDFPTGTAITKNLPNEPVVGPADVQIASNSTILDAVACGITGIEGTLNSDSYTAGAYLKSPAETGNGTWRLVVSAGKKAHWACAK